MLRAALRLAAGTVSLATGGWVLRALHGAPAALGAQPADIHAVADRSPNFHDGVFVNLEPASLNIDTEEQRNILWELISGRAAAPAPGGDPAGHPRAASLRGSRGPNRGQLVRPFDGAAGNRRLPRAHRPGLERTLLAVGRHRARGACIRRRCRWTRCRRWTRSSSATTITTTSTSTRSSRWPEASGPRSWFHSVSARTCGSGAFPTSASSNSTGMSTRRSTSSPWSAHRPGTSPAGSSTATQPCGRHGRLSVRRTGPTSAATPATPRASPKSAKSMDLST